MSTYVRFTELPVMDQKRAVQFYTEKLGFRVAKNVPYKAEWRWIELEIPGAQTKILLTRNTSGERRGVPSLVLKVDDVHASCRELQRKGVAFTQGPVEADWNPSELFALFEDSEGNLVMLGSDAAGDTTAAESPGKNAAFGGAP